MNRRKSRTKKTKYPGFSEGETSFTGSEQKPPATSTSAVAHVELGAAGRLVIPAAMRTALGMKPGDKLTVRLEDDQLSVYTAMAGIRRVQKRLGPYLPKDAVDQFLRSKRQEAAKEEQEMDRWTRGE
jgi:AbrB family looped-hinge helix DNA binding protein